MRRRLDLAARARAQPRVLFLDEPTTGPRPAQPRRRCGDEVRALNDERHDDLPHDAVPRGGRAARRPRRHHRRRAARRRGHAGRAQARLWRADAARRLVDGDRRGGAAALLEAVGRVTAADGCDLVVRTPSRRPRHRAGGPRAGRGRHRASTPSRSEEPTLDDVFLAVTGHRALPGEDGDEDEDQLLAAPAAAPAAGRPRRPPGERARVVTALAGALSASSCVARSSWSRRSCCRSCC